jgi:hypothetical protein
VLLGYLVKEAGYLPAFFYMKWVGVGQKKIDNSYRGVYSGYWLGCFGSNISVHIRGGQQ